MTPHQDHDSHSCSSGLNLHTAGLYEGEMDTRTGAIFDGQIEGQFDLNLAEDLFRSTTPAITGVDSTGSLPLLQPPTTDLQYQHATGLSQNYATQTVNQIPAKDSHGVPSEVMQTPMQQLSKLDYDIITLIYQLDQGHPNLVMRILSEDASVSSQSVVDNILKSTNTFADVLKRLRDSSLQPSTVSPTTDSNRSSSCSYDTTRTRRSDSYSSDCDSMDSPNQLSPSTPPVHPELDTPSLLLVLTTYIRLLRLYSILFAGVYEHLKELSKRENPHLHPVAGLRMSGFPIGKVAIHPRTQPSASNILFPFP